MKKLHPFLLFLINSNIFVSFCVLSLAVSSEILLDSSCSQISLFVFFATIFTYNFQRIVRVSKTQRHDRKNWIKKNKFLIYLIMIISVIMSLYFFSNFKTNTQIAIIFSGVLSISYPFGLRKIPFAKIFIISLVWTISTVLLIVLENNIPFNSNILLHLLCRFLFIVAICIPFDIRDIKFDKEELKTIPIKFGISKSKLIAISTLILAVVFHIIQYLHSQFPFHYLISIMITYITTSILISNSSENKKDFFFSFGVESLSIIFYLFLLLSVLML